MPKKNLLREVRELDTTKEKYPYAVSDWWEAWQCRSDDVDNPENWGQVEEGTLQECIQALTNVISRELELEMRQDGSTQRLSAKYDDEPQKFTNEMKKRHQKKRSDIKKQCLMTGKHSGSFGNWVIRSVLTREQLAYKEEFGM